MASGVDWAAVSALEAAQIEPNRDRDAQASQAEALFGSAERRFQVVESLHVIREREKFPFAFNLGEAA